MLKLGYCNDCDQYGIVGYMACRRQNLCPSCVAEALHKPIEVVYVETLSQFITEYLRKVTAKVKEELMGDEVIERINEDSGCPELLVNGVLMEPNTDYHAPAMWFNKDAGVLYLVLGHYWEGSIPSELIGVALKMTKV